MIRHNVRCFATVWCGGLPRIGVESDVPLFKVNAFSSDMTLLACAIKLPKRRFKRYPGMKHSPLALPISDISPTDWATAVRWYKDQTDGDVAFVQSGCLEDGAYEDIRGVVKSLMENPRFLFWAHMSGFADRSYEATVATLRSESAYFEEPWQYNVGEMNKLVLRWSLLATGFALYETDRPDGFHVYDAWLHILRCVRTLVACEESSLVHTFFPNRRLGFNATISCAGYEPLALLRKQAE